MSENAAKNLSDDEWYALQFDHEKAKREFDIPLPGIPDEDTQVGFTAQSGESNMRQAFDFYRYMRSTCHLENLDDPKVVDFGGGWGRICRFFLRDTKPENIFLTEARASVIKLLEDASAPYTLVHNDPPPPILGLPGSLDLVFAFSVFSHLSEEYFLNWTRYFLTKLRPGGHIVFTSRGNYFINHLRKLHASEATAPKNLAEHIRRLKEMMPEPEEIQRRFDAGEFQYYPLGGSAELTANFFGEAFIPKAYLEKHFGDILVDFTEALPRVGQSVTVLRKK